MTTEAILVTVTEVLGSAPREVGTSMLVFADDLEGTIGGGNLEWRAIEAARAMLAAGEAVRELALPLGPTLAQCCGGHVSLSLRRLAASEIDGLRRAAGRARAALPLVALFGAGHVGRAVAQALRPLPCRLRWIDSRPDIFPPMPGAEVETVLTHDPAAAVTALPSGGFVLVMTHSHPLDLEIVAAALAREDLAWIGLIGSETKRRRFTSQLRARCLPGPAIDRLVCPIGLRGIEGKEPAVIAASTAAQLLITFEAQAARRAIDRVA
jgi:xanthine dehydrogenase accessory protein XdhC